MRAIGKQDKHEDLRGDTGIQTEESVCNITPREQRGFTLVEMIVTLTIAAIIAAVTIPSLVTWYRSYKATERQANAELIYTTAQNNIAQLKANGQLNEAKNSTAAVTGDRVTLASATNNVGDKSASAGALGNDAGIIALSSDDTSAQDALKLLVPNIDDALSRVGYSSMSYSTSSHYRIELNPTTGYVYRVYFAEDAISNNDVSGKSDDELAAAGIGAYGNTVPKTFKTEQKQPASWVGYFEFAKDGDTTSATGGYFYQIYEDYSTSDDAVDKLHNDNKITEGAVDSTDGTAYGVMVPKSKVDNNSFTPPTSFTKRYSVKLDKDLGVEGQEVDCYFYELGAPASAHEGWAKYTITYNFYDFFGVLHLGSIAQDDLQAPVGSTVSVTDDDLASLGWLSLLFGPSWGSQTPTATVQANGSTNLSVNLHLLGGGSTSKPTIDDSNQAIIPTGVGVWHPWDTVTNNATLQGKAFYVNQNFAGCISKGDQAPSDTSSYQVRTDDQLQHIGSPYGSAPASPNTNYLADDFYQTHDITINQAWSPIGQDQANGTNEGKSRFSGHFYGGYSGYASEDHSNLQPPTDEDGKQDFSITLAERESQTDDSLRKALFNTDPAYNTTSDYRSYGIFGYVTGGISHAHVSVGTEDARADLSQSFDTPHYGTLVGDLTDKGTIDHSSVDIAKDSSMHIAQGNQQESWRNTDDAIVGGLCGYMGGNATISDSSLTLEDNNDGEREPRFELAASPRENIGKSVSVGGLVGRASCESEKFLTNCTVELDDDTRIDAQGNTSGNRQVSAGGLIGYAKAGDQASIEGCDMTLKGTLTVETPDSNGAWSNPTFIGGLAGYVEGGTGIKNATIKDIENASGSIVATAKANGVRAAAGGMFGYLHNTGFDTATVDIDGDLNVTAASTNSDGHAGGLVGRADSDDSGLTLEKASLTVGGNETIANSATINNTLHASYNAYAGGLAGSLSNMTLSNATATVNGDGKSLKVSADNAHTSATAGGLVGELERAGNVTAPKLTARTLTVTSSDDNSSALSGGLIGKATDDAGANSAIGNAAITVNGDADIESTGAQQYVLSGLFAGQLGSVGVDTATSNVTGSLTTKATSTNNASARAAGLIAQFEDGPALNAPKLTVGKDLSVTADSTYGGALTGGLLAYASHGSSPIQATNASLSVTGKLDAQSHSDNTSQDSFSGALAGQLRSFGFSGPNDAPWITVGGKLTSKAESPNGPAYAGGLVGKVERSGNTGAAALSKVASTLHDVSVSASSDNGDTYAGGFVGRDDSSAISDSPIAAGGLSVSATKSGKGLYAGGYVGSISSASVANDTSSATLSTNGSMHVDATGGQGQANAGGFAGRVDTSTLTDASVQPAGEVGVSATSTNSSTYAGGLAGNASSSNFSRASLLESGNATNTSVSVTSNCTGWSDSYAAGGFGRVDDTSIDNSYVVTRNVPLALSNKSNSNQVYTGGFAGYVTGRGIKSCYLSSDIISNDNKGISAFADHFDSSQLWADYVIATMADGSGNALSNGYAFSRDCGTFSSSSDWPAGDYAIVADRSGTTPYKFLGWKPEESDISTPACVIYDAKATDPVPGTDKGEIGQRVNGAHPVSLAWLAGTAPYDDGYNKNAFDEDNPYHYRNYVEYVGTKTDGTSRYPYVMGSTVAAGSRDGDNPYPTATKAKDGTYVNYGRWPAAPAGQASSPESGSSSTTDTQSDTGSQDSAAQNATNTSAGGTNANANAANPNQTSNSSASGNAGANALSTSSPSADSTPSTSDNATGGDGNDR